MAGKRPSQIFEDFCVLTETCLDSLNRQARQVMGIPTTPIDAGSKTAVERVWAQYDKTRHMPYFEEALQVLLDSADTDYLDLIGLTYMNFGHPSKGNGQFFTPWHVAQLMAMLSTDRIAEVNTRLKAAIDKSPLAQAALITGLACRTPEEAEAWFVTRVIPFAMEHYEPVLFNDPCCGSGVMFLAYASCLPWWATQLGLVRFYGMDIDRLCVRMCKINSMLYGLNGFNAPMILLHYEMVLSGKNQPNGKPVVETAVPAPPKTAFHEPVDLGKTIQLNLFG